MQLHGDWYQHFPATKGWGTTDTEGHCDTCGKRLARGEVWIDYGTWPRGGERCKAHVPAKEA